MCIRDRDIDHEMALLKKSTTKELKLSAELAILEKMPNVIPVSYTHLRAHETVLDLVCRLLLEKKKKHHTTATIIYIHNI